MRKEKHISQEKLAFDLNVARQTVSKWENGVCLPDTEKLMDLCQYFECSPDYLLYDRQTAEEKTESGKKKFRWIQILMLAEAVCICIILFCAQMIPAKKEIHQMAEVRDEYTQETVEEYVTDTMEVTELLPFLKTYHLRIVFGVLCADLCVNLIFCAAERRKK